MDYANLQQIAGRFEKYEKELRPALMVKAVEDKRTGEAPVRFRTSPSLRAVQGALEENGSLVWQNRIFYLFIAPFAALTILFGAWPIILSIIVSFTDSYSALGDAPVFVGFANFSKIFADPLFLKSLYSTTLFTIAAVVLNVGLALALALFLTNPFLKYGGAFFRLAIFLPVITPDVASFIVWKWMVSENFGAVNAFLSVIGAPPFSGVTRPDTAFITLLLVELWHNVGFYTVIFLSNIQLLDQTLDEAAKIDGANLRQRIRYVWIPQLRPAITINAIYALIQFLKTFTVVIVISKGGPAFSTNFLSYYAYSKFDQAQYGQATAMATVLFGMVMTFALAMQYYLERGDHR